MQSRTKRIAFRSRSSLELAKILDGIRRGGYVCRLSYRQKESAHVGAREMALEKTREAGRTIIAIMFPAHVA